MKKPLIILLAALFVFALSACKSDVTEEIDQVVSYRVDGASTEIIWQAQADSTLDLYRSLSLYGDYRLVKRSLGGGSYVDNARGYYYKAVLRNADGKKIKEFPAFGEPRDMFSDNVYVFSPTDGAESVETVIRQIAQKQYAAEFTDERFAFFFHPGVYQKTIKPESAYYTTISGLGETPEAVTLPSLYNGNGANGNALINFWRGAENFTVASSVTYAVSQGTFLRRIAVKGDLAMSENGGWSSGGYISDCNVQGTIMSGSQQQWLTKNSSMGSWKGQVWNMVFTGDINAPTENYPDDKYTTIEKTEISYGKPYLAFTDNGYKLLVPARRENAVGYNWSVGSAIDVENVYFARPDRDTADSVNKALASGKHLFFNPGVYAFDKPIEVTVDGTIVLGTGLATIRPADGNDGLVVSAKNVTVAGILFDAGEKTSETLLRVGRQVGDAENVRIMDCFFRVGGYTENPVGVKTAAEVYSDNAYIDNVWLWRADHGSGVGWKKNDGAVGMKLFGDNARVFGLFAEHFEENNVYWSGKNGRLVFYQSETAYDVPSDDEWSDNGAEGYASLKITGDGFKGYGLGVYTNFYNDITLHAVIDVAEGISAELTHVCTIKMQKGQTLNMVGDAPVGNGFLEKYLQ